MNVHRLKLPRAKGANAKSRECPKVWTPLEMLFCPLLAMKPKATLDQIFNKRLNQSVVMVTIEKVRKKLK